MPARKNLLTSFSDRSAEMWKNFQQRLRRGQLTKGLPSQARAGAGAHTRVGSNLEKAISTAQVSPTAVTHPRLLPPLSQQRVTAAITKPISTANTHTNFAQLSILGKKVETENNAHSAPETQNFSELKPNRTYQAEQKLENYLLALKQNHCSPATIRNYKSDIKQFLDFTAEDDLKIILTKPKLLAFLENQQSKGLQPATIKRKLISIAQFSLWAKRGKLLGPDMPSGLSQATEHDLMSLIELHQLGLGQSSSPASTPVSKPSKKPQADIILPVANSHQSFGKLGNILPFFNLGLIALFLVGLGYFSFRQFKEVDQSLAYPSTLTRPSRILSFQGRLTDQADTPIVAGTSMRFRLFNNITGGTQLWDSNICTVDPDVDGIFNTSLGAGVGGGSDDEDCGAEIPNAVFSENSNVWLQVTIGSETLTPRQPIRTVPYALNSETLQGFPASASAVENTVLIMNNSGQVVLGSSNPEIVSTGDTFTLEGEAITIQSTPGSNTDLTLNSDRNILFNAGIGGSGGAVISQDYFAAPGATLSATYAGGTALTVKAGPSATADIMRWQNSGGTNLGVINSAGTFGIGTDVPESKLTVSDNIQLGVTDATRYIYFDNGTGNNSGFRYNATTDKMQFSHDGVNWSNIIDETGVVTSVSNVDGTLTISPTTGDVIASLNLTNSNTWTGLQTFNNSITDFAQFLRHAGDTDTYIQFTPDVVGINAGGKNLLNLDVSASQDLVTIGNGSDVDTQIMADLGTVGLFVQGSNGWVGLNGVTTPNQALEVGGSGTIRVGGLTASLPVKTNANKDLISGAINLASAEVTGVLPIANGGTNGTATPTAGGVAYGTGTAYAFTAAGTSGEVLVSNGSGAPGWFDPNTVFPNYWDRTLEGVIFPREENDVVAATSSATTVLTVTQLDNSKLAALIGGNTSSTRVSIDGDGNVGVGNIAPNNKFTVGSSNQFQITSTGTIAAATGITSSGNINFTGLGAGGTDTVVTHNSGLLQSRTIDSRVWGSTLVDGSGNANYVAFWSDNNTLTSEQYLSTSRGGLGANMTAGGIGELIYSDSTTTYDTLAAGTSGYVLRANGAAAPSWVDVDTLTTNYWNRSGEGVVYPKTLNDVVAATSSAATVFTATQQNSSLLAARIGGTTDSTVMVVDGNGNVGIGDVTPDSKFAVGPNSEFQVDATGAIAAATGISSSGDINFSSLGAGSTDTVVTHNSGLLQTRIIDSRVWGSSLVDGSGTTNYVTYWSDANTLAAEQYLSVTRGGLGGDVTAAGAGELLYSTSTTAYDTLAAGTSGYVLQSNGVAAPSWVDVDTIVTNYWNKTSEGVIYPRTENDVVAATSSASTVFTATQLDNSLLAARIGGVSDADVMVVDGDGNVGIGNTAPSAKFTVGAGNEFRIDAGGTITAATGITSSGAIQFTSLGAGTTNSVIIENGGGVLQKRDVDPRVWGTSLVDGSGLAGHVAFWLDGNTLDAEQYLSVIRGGLGNDVTAAGAGELLYSSSTTTYDTLAAGTSNFVLKSNGAAAPSWVDVNGLVDQLWERSGEGILYPNNLNDGIAATSSATTVFTATQQNSSLLAARIGGTTDSTVMVIDGNGNVGIGDVTPDSKFAVGPNSEFQVDAAGEITAATGITSSGDITFTALNAGATDSVVIENSGLLQTRVIDSRVWGSSLVDGSGTAGYNAYWSDANTLTAEQYINVSRGGLGNDVTAAGAGEILYSTTASTYDSLAAGTTGFLLQSNGAAAPSWIDPALVGTNYWSHSTEGVIYPMALNDVVAATSSATTVFTATQQNTSLLAARIGGTTDSTVMVVDGNGNVGVGDITPNNKFAVGTNSEFQVTSGGAIAAATGITSSGSITFTGMGTGATDTVITHNAGLLQTRTIDSRVWGSSLVDGSGTANYVTYWSDANTLTAEQYLSVTRGGLGGDVTAAGAGEVLYSTGTTTYDTLAAGTSGYVLSSNGAAAPSWVDVNSLISNYWTRSAQGVVYPSTANDVVAATSSATTVFTATQQNASLLAARIGGTTDSTVMVVDGNGNVGVGDVTPDSKFAVGPNSEFQVNSSGAIAAATGITSSGNVTFTGLGAGATDTVVTHNAGLLQTRTIDSRVWGSTLVDGSGTSNYVTYWSDANTLAAEQYLATSRGGLGSDVTAAGAGEILYSTGASAYDSLAAGNAGYLLTSNGAGAPSWTDPSLVGTNYWGHTAQGILYPVTINDGIAATSSATTVFTATQQNASLLAARIGGTTDSTVMVVDGNGNVGIGDITPGNKFAVGSNSEFQVTSGGAIAAATGITSSGNITFTGMGAGATDSVVTNNSGLLQTRTIDSRVWGSTLVDGTGTTNYVTYWSDANTLTAEQYLNVTRGGLGADVTAAGAGELLYSTGASAFDSLAAGTSGYVLQSNGAAAPSWVNVNSIVTNYWTRSAQGVVYPTTLNDIVAATSSSSTVFTATQQNSSLLAARIGGTTDSTVMVVDGNGNVGIGDVTPGNKFTVGPNSEFQVDSSGTIAAATGITSSGNITFTGLGSGSTDTVVTHNSGLLQTRTIDSRVWGSSLVDGSGTTNYITYWSDANTLTAEQYLATSRGGLGGDVTAAGAGEILYSTGTTAYDSLAAGVAGYLLTSNGAGAPSWTNPALVGTNYWGRTAQGVIYPAAVNDVIAATSSATTVFTATQQNASLLAARIGGTTDSTVMVVDGNGNVGVGDVTPGNKFAVGPNSEFQVTSGGAIAAATGITSSGSITFTGLGAGATDSVVTNNSGLLQTRTIDSRVWGSSLVDGSGTTNYVTYWSDANTLAAEQYLSVTRGGLGGDVTAAGAGEIIYSTGTTAYDTLAAGTSGYLLQSTGAGAPTWVNPASVGNLHWSKTAQGVIYPTNLNDVIAATSSATTVFTATQQNSSLLAARIGGTTNSTVMVVDGSGNLGVGDVSPDNKFTVGPNSEFQVTSGGAIAAATGITSSGNVTFTGLGAGATDTVVTHNSGLLQTRTIDSRVWGSSLVDGSGTTNYVTYWSDANTLAAEQYLATSRGGLGGDVTAAGAGEVLYSTGTTTYDSLAAGVSGYILTSNGAGAPSWTNPALVGTNYWGRTAQGILYPATVNDGVAATSSATTVLTATQQNSSLLAARIGGTSDSTSVVIDGNGNLGVGDVTPGNKFAVGPNSEFQVTSGGAIAAATGITSSGSITFTGMGSGATDTVVTHNSGLLQTRTIDSRVWGSTLVDGSGTTNYVTYWSDANTLSAEQYLSVTRGGLGSDVTAAGAGELLYSTGTTTYDSLAAGTSGYILQSTGAGAPSWVNPSVVFTNYWTRSAQGIVSPTTLNDGVAATSSATTVFTATQQNSSLLAARIGGTTNSTVMVVDGNGNVGVGDVTPDSKFTVGTNSEFQVNSSGAIAAATGITSSGSVTFTGMGAGATDTVVTHNAGLLQTRTIDSRVWGSSLVDGSGTTNYVTYWSDANTLAAEQYLATSRGGLGGNVTAAGAGELIYSTGATTYDSLAAGTATYILQSNGAAAPSWVSPASLGTNYWGRTAQGIVYPATVNDGIAATSSATTVFTATQQNSSLLAARIGGTSDSTSVVVDGNGNLGIGDVTPGNKLAVGPNSEFQVSSGGAIAAATGITSSGNITFTGLGAGATDTVVTHNAGLLQTRTIDSRVWGSTLVDGSGTSNYVTYWSDANTLTAEQYLNVTRGGLGGNVTAAGAGELIYSTGTTTYDNLAAGTSGYILQSTGAGAPSWVAASSVFTNYWNRSAQGILSPSTLNDGIAATTSATTAITATQQNASLLAARLGGTTAYATFDASGNLGFTNGSGSTITASTGLTIDGTGALSIGGTNATSTTIGRAAVDTTINGANIVLGSQANASTEAVRADRSLTFTQEVGGNLTVTNTGSAQNFTADRSWTFGWTGQLAATRGGTGIGSYAVGDLLYADTTTTLAKLADVAVGNVLLSGGVNTAPSWGKVDLTAAVSGVLPIANGGTNSNTALSNGRVMVSSGGSIVERAALATDTLLIGNASTGLAPIAAGAGTAGQILRSNGAGAEPTWTSTLPSGTTVSFSDITSGTNTTAAMVVGTGATLDFTGSGTINASSLLGGTWAVPGAIGSTTPNTGAFTTLSANATGNALTLSGAGANINFSGAGDAQVLTAASQDLLFIPGAGGNVGINNTNPTYKLTINGDDDLEAQLLLRSNRSAITNNDVVGGIDFASNDDTNADPGTVTAAVRAIAVATHTATALDTELAFYTTNAAVFSEKIRIDDAGQMGILNTNPSNKLTIANTGDTENQIALRSNRAAITAGESVGGMDFVSNDTTLTAPGIITATFRALASATHTATVLDTDFVFTNTSGTTISEVMRIEAGGNTGIGVTNPNYRLDVGGDINLTGALRANGSAGTSGYVLTSSGGGVNTWTDITTLVGNYWSRSAQGVISPLNLNDVIAATSSATTVFTATQQNTSLLAARIGGTTAATSMVVDGNGNVGIGALTAAGKLDITDTSNTAAALILTNNTATTIGNGANTVGVIDLQSTSLTTGNFLNIELNSLTSGKGINLTTTSTALNGGSVFNVSATGNPGASWTGNLGLIEYSTSTDADIDGSALKVGITGAGAGDGIALNVSTGQTGSSALAMRVNDDGTYTDSTPFVITSSGNLGLGTASPLLKFDSAGSGRFTGTATSVLTGSIDPVASTTVTGVGTLFQTELVVGDRITVSGQTRTVTAIASNTSLTVDTAFSDNAVDAAVDKLHAILIARDSSNTLDMVLSDQGFLGINQIAPSSPLHVSRSGGGQVAEFGDSTAANTYSTRYASSGNSYDLAISSAGNFSIYRAGTTNGITFYDASDDITLNETSGNVGIGVTTPSGKFDVGSTSNTTATFYLANNTATTLGAGANTTGVIDLQSTSLTTGNFMNIELNALTSGDGINLTTTSTGLTTGNFLNVAASGNPSASWTGSLGSFEYLTSTDADIDGSALKVGIMGAGAGAGTALNVTTAQTSSTSYALRVNDDGTYTDSTALVVDINGNLGVGTTSPLLKLETAGSARITGTATSVLTGSIDPIASTTVTGVGTLFQTELVVGDRITVTGETRTVTAIASNTSLTVDTAFSNNANDAAVDRLPALFIVRDSSNANQLTMNNLGNLGIGTSAPGVNNRIDIYNGATQLFYVDTSKYAYAKRWYDIDNTAYYLEPGNATTSLNIAGNITMGTNKTISGTNLTVNTGSGTVSANKITANTFDPPYWIDGVRYATYAPAMIGVNEEIAQSVTLQATGTPKLYKYVIDFDHLTYGSPLWLYARVIDLDAEMKNLHVLVSADNDARVFYKKDLARRQLIFFGTAPAEISYRLTAPRFDHAEHGHQVNDTDPLGLRPDTFIFGNVPSGATPISDADLLASVETAEEFSLNDLGMINITTNVLAQTATLTDSNGNLINRFTAFTEAVVGKIRAGFVVTQSLTAEDIAGTNAVIENLETENAQVNELNATTSRLGSLLGDVATISGNLTVQGKTALGELSSEKLTVNDDALIDGDLTVSGTASIAAGRLAYIESKLAQLETVKAQTAELTIATVSGTLYANNIADFDAKVAQTFRQPSLIANLLNQENLPTELDLPSTATSASELKQSLASLNLGDNDVVLTPSAVFIKNYFEANGNGFIAGSLGVGQQLVIGEGLVVTENTISYQPVDMDENTTFNIQPAGRGKLALLGGIMQISEGGLVEITGDLWVSGDINAGKNLDVKGEVSTDGNLSAKGTLASNRFEIVDDLGTPVATISADGKANFSSLAVDSENITATGSGTVNSSQAAGRAKLTAGQTELTIKSERINSNSLIYVTPLSSTNNQVLYVKAQVAEDPGTTIKEGEFQVGLDTPIGTDVEFNWWIVN